MKIVFDIGLMRPACVLVQAALGGDPEVAHRFPLNSWLLAPTDGMKVYELTEEQIPILVGKVQAAMCEQEIAEKGV